MTDREAGQEAGVWIHFADSGEAHPQTLDLGKERIMACSLPNPVDGGSNEDCAAVVRRPEGQVVMVVADGVGGSRQGQLASRLAVECVVEAVRQADPGIPRLRTVLIDAIEEADRRVRQLKTGAATTLAIAEIHQGELTTYHCGDSTVMVCGVRGRIRSMTVGHNPTEMAVHAGWMDAASALQHHERHLVSNILGQPPLRIEVGPRLALLPRDTVLLATDGLFDNLVPAEIADLIRREPMARNFERLIAEAQRRMSDEAGQYNKPDDLSVIAWREPRAA